MSQGGSIADSISEVCVAQGHDVQPPDHQGDEAEGIGHGDTRALRHAMAKEHAERRANENCRDIDDGA